MQKIDYNSLPGACRQPINRYQGCILHKDGSGFSKEEAPKIAAKLLSSLIECTPVRKYLLKYNRRIVCDGAIWQFVCAKHEEAECYICPDTICELTVALFGDPKCNYIFEDLGLKVIV